ncbi:MAG: hypothetical protein ACXVRJ_06955, partial [Gaiellaceae bacterium]
ADRLIEEVVAALQDYQHETDEFVTGTRERLVSLVRDLVGRIPGSAPEYVAAPPVEPEAEAAVVPEPEAGEAPPAADAAAA